ncbi:phosphodiester glycosidase family protein [bacterium SCSIO 12844]|nr:phosphodiester glycosidase family protein [bacterium SCSIO 12844]
MFQLQKKLIYGCCLFLMLTNVVIAAVNEVKPQLDQTIALNSFIHSIDQKQLQALPKNKNSLVYRQKLNHLINKQLNQFAGYNYQWICKLAPNGKELLDNKNVTQYQVICNGQWPNKANLNKLLQLMFKEKPNINNIKLHFVIANVNDVTVKPVIAKYGNYNFKDKSFDCSKYPYCQQSLLQMTNVYNQQNPKHKAYAVINGSYFYRYSPTGVFYDMNCIWKSFDQIILSSRGSNIKLNTKMIGDGLTIIDSKVYASNCATYALNEVNGFGISTLQISSPQRATFVISRDINNHKIIEIKNMSVGEEKTSPNIIQALGAGPMLMQQGAYQLQWQDIPGTFQYSANPGLAIVSNKHNHNDRKIVFFSVDGNNWQNGMFSFELANLINELLSGKVNVSGLEKKQLELDYNVISMMALDRGGSTAMITCKNGSDCKKITNAGEGLDQKGRRIFNGLAITMK